MAAYTDADVKAAQEAIGNFFGPDGNFDYYAAREAVAAVAPAIAARALREHAADLRAAVVDFPEISWERVQNEATAEIADRRADEIASSAT